MLKKLSVFIVILVFLLTGCDVKGTHPVSDYSEQSSSATTKQTKAKEDWTILIYMCGNNLETKQGEATKNLNEIMAADLPENINVIIQTGGTLKWRNNIVSSNYCERYKIDNHKMVRLAQLPQADMGDSKTLSDFLSWGVENYPAQKTMTLIWDHGSGSVNGVAFDELYGNDSLTLPELDDAFSHVSSKFEIVGFDACLMETVDTAEILAKYARYLIASEDVETGEGWDYTNWLTYLSKHLNTDGATLGKEICDGYYEKAALNGKEDTVTLSVADLSKVKDLTDAWDKISSELAVVSKTPTGISDISRSIENAVCFGGNSKNEGYSNSIDMGSTAAQFVNLGLGSLGNVKRSLSGTVIYNVCGKLRAGATGLSFFYPCSYDTDELNKYLNVCKIKQYALFLQAIYLQPQQKTKKVEFKNTGYVDENGKFAIEVTDNSQDIIKSVGVELTEIEDLAGNTGGVNIKSLGVSDLDVKSKKSVSFYADFSGMWYTVNGSQLNVTTIEQTKGYSIYSSPVLINDEKKNLRFAKSDKGNRSDEYNILGVWDGVDSISGISPRGTTPLTNGDVMTILYEKFLPNSYDTALFNGKSFTINNPVKLSLEPLPKMYYNCRFIITDIYDNVYLSNSAVYRMELTPAEILKNHNSGDGKAVAKILAISKDMDRKPS